MAVVPFVVPTMMPHLRARLYAPNDAASQQRDNRTAFGRGARSGRAFARS
jgi:hypothetical protein